MENHHHHENLKRTEPTETNPAEKEILYHFSLNVIATQQQLSEFGIGCDKNEVHTSPRTNEDNVYLYGETSPGANSGENLNPDITFDKQQTKEHIKKKELCIPGKIYQAQFQEWQIEDYKECVLNFWKYSLAIIFGFLTVYYYQIKLRILTSFFFLLEVYTFVYNSVATYIVWNNIYNYYNIPNDDAKEKQNVKECATKGGDVNIILCAYLPNEKNILLETMDHIIHTLDNANRKISFCVCYNTPEPITPTETKILQFHNRTINQRRVYVVKNETSKSKAENINYALDYFKLRNELHEYIYIIDADHHPDPDCLQLLLNKIESEPDIDCVHGATYIRNTEYSTLAKYIHAEFWCFYNVILYVLKGFSGCVFFGGSNGIWKTNSISYFDPTIQTEDIEMSIRALLNNATIDFEPAARSGELAPVNMDAFITQRTRWAMGWNEVTFKYFTELWTCPVTSFKRRLGLFFLLPFRFILPWGFLIGVLHFDFHRLTFTTSVLLLMEAGLFIWITCQLPLSFKFRTPQEQLQDTISMVIFLLLLPVNLIQQQIFEILANFRIYYRTSSDWLVTRRSHSD